MAVLAMHLSAAGTESIEQSALSRLLTEHGLLVSADQSSSSDPVHVAQLEGLSQTVSQAVYLS